VAQGLEVIALDAQQVEAGTAALVEGSQLVGEEADATDKVLV
jgi:hypothetical protein